MKINKSIVNLLLIFIFSINIVFMHTDAAAAESLTDSIDIERAAINVVQNSADYKKVCSGYDMVLKLDKEVNNVKNSKLKMLLLLPEIYSYNLSGMSKYEISMKMQLLPDNAHNNLYKVSNTKDTVKNEVRVAAYSLYIKVLEAQYRVQVQEKLVSNDKFNSDTAQTKLEAGLISKSDYIVALNEYKDSQLVQEKYENDLKSAKMALNKMSGEALDKSYSLYKYDNITPSKEISQLNSFTEAALQSRAEILNNIGDLEYKKEEQNYEKVYHPVDTDIYFVTSNYDIHDTENKIDNAKIEVQKDINNGYKNLESKIGDWKRAEKQYDLAQAAYDNTKKAHEQGLISEYDLMVADKNLASARIQLKVTELEAWLYETRIDIASGIGPGISEQDSLLLKLGGGK